MIFHDPELDIYHIPVRQGKGENDGSVEGIPGHRLDTLYRARDGSREDGIYRTQANIRRISIKRAKGVDLEIESSRRIKSEDLSWIRRCDRLRDRGMYSLKIIFYMTEKIITKALYFHLLWKK